MPGRKPHGLPVELNTPVRLPGSEWVGEEPSHRVGRPCLSPGGHSRRIRQHAVLGLAGETEKPKSGARGLGRQRQKEFGPGSGASCMALNVLAVSAARRGAPH